VAFTKVLTIKFQRKVSEKKGSLEVKALFLSQVLKLSEKHLQYSLRMLWVTVFENF
jgi:hypothetical protein